MTELFNDIAQDVKISSSQLETTQVIAHANGDDLAEQIPVCAVCECALLSNGKEFIECYACRVQWHIKCIKMSKRDFNKLKTSETKWCCVTCQQIEVTDSEVIQEQDVCSHCMKVVTSSQRGLFCESRCNSWYHAECVGIKPKRYKELTKNQEPWSCNTCRLSDVNTSPDRPPDIAEELKNSVVWGYMNGVDDISRIVNEVYKTVAGWSPNLFMLPSGKEGNDFIDELIITLRHFTEKSACESFAITSFLIMIPLILQKPSQNSKSAEHRVHLKRRLEMWRQGKLGDLVKECEQIQSRLRSKRKDDENKSRKVFVRLMLQGNVRSAMKWITSSVTNGAPVDINEETLNQLAAKHPPGKPKKSDFILQGPLEPNNFIRFEELDEETIYSSALGLSGSGGPSGLNADGLRRMLCSKSFKSRSKNLCYEIARLARRICSENVVPTALTTFTACRLIPLSEDSGQGIRPIGIGEVLRRVIGKAVMRHLKLDVLKGAGPLQACSGQRSGCEAAIHAMRQVYEDPDTEAVLLIDATNAFNCMNREVALHNIDYVCPPMSQFLRNTYNQPVDLFVRSKEDVVVLKATEGTTQGDPSASGWYALSTIPIIQHLKEIRDCKTQQAWFADDSAAGGKLSSLKTLWDELERLGPGYGYFPNARKTVLIVKEQFLDEAKRQFGETGVIVTREGQRHLGAVIGSLSFREQYVSELVDGWVKEVETLAEYASSEPQAAYAAFTFGLVHKWGYFQRTIPETSHLYHSLENVIREKLIPALTGHTCSDLERNLFSLPCRLGGLGIPNPVDTAASTFRDSVFITEPLVEEILNQGMILNDELMDAIESRVKIRKEAKIAALKNKQADLLNHLPDHLKRATQLNSEKGSSCWLSSLPIASCGFYLNKRAFHDALCLRYNWRIEQMAVICACGERNTVNHALICKKGGFVIRRHNEIRDIEAELLDEVCISVTKEPPLLPLSGERVRGNQADEARLDVSAIGFWRPQEKMFVDVRVFDPNCQSYKEREPNTIYAHHETQKKNEYNDRVLNVEHGTLTPLVFSTTGGWGREATKFHKHLAQLIAEKRSENYSTVMGFIRKRLRFTLLRTVLESLRGSRGIRRKYLNRAWKIQDTDINIIDYRDSDLILQNDI